MHDLRAPKTQNCYQIGSYLVVPIRRQLWALTFYNSDLCARILPLSVTLQALLIYTRCPHLFLSTFQFFLLFTRHKKKGSILQVLQSEVGCSAHKKKRKEEEKSEVRALQKGFENLALCKNNNKNIYISLLHSIYWLMKWTWAAGKRGVRFQKKKNGVGI